MADQETASKPESAVRFNVPYSIGRDNYFRHECGSCGLHFKTLSDPSALSTLLAPAIKRISEYHSVSLTPTEDLENNGEIQTITCPYCGHRDQPQNMNTPEFIQFAIRWLEREVVHPALEQFNRDIERTFSQSGRGGLFRFKYEGRTSPKPIRPISGPELLDMKLVMLLCCNQTVKIADNWLATIFCPYCSQELVLQ